MKIEDDVSSPVSATHLFQKKTEINTTMNFQTIELVTNHFPVSFEQDISFNEWAIRFLDKNKKEEFEKDPKSVPDPVPQDSRVLIRQVLRSNRALLYKILGNHFHTGLTLYTFGISTNIQDHYLLEEHEEYIISIDLKAKNQTFKNLQQHEPSKKQLLRSLNSKLKNILRKMNFYEFGRLKKYYNFDEKVDVPKHNVEIYKGFNTAFDMYEAGLRLLIDNSCRILRTKNLWQEFLESKIPKDDLQSIRKFFIGVNCVASYGNNRRYRIDDVEFNLMVQNKFPDDTFKTYADYFKQKYQKNIHYKDQFMLVSNITFFKKVGDHEMEKVVNTVHLVPELLQGTGLTDYQKKNFHVMKDIGKTTIQSPQDRFKQISKFAQDISNSKIDQFQFKIDLKNNVVKAYKLPKPKLKARDRFQPDRDRIQLRELYRNEKIKDWVFLYDYKFYKDVDRIIENLKKSCQRYNIQIDYPKVTKEIPRRCRASELPQLYEHRVKYPKLIFFFCSSATGNYIYGDVKSFYQKIGIPTQFYTSFNFRRDSLSKYGNLALQIVNKIGGALWVYQDAPRDTVVIGVDKIKLKNGQFVAAAVAQMGEYFRRPLALLEQVIDSKDSVHLAISRIIINVCEYYKKKYEKLPKNIIVYRACQSARDISNMIDKEVLTTKKTIQQMYEKESIIPKLNVIMVTKKIGDKFFQKTSQGLSNPEGVAIVDDVVLADRINFFLVAQKVNQGTATPTHYQVVYNQSELGLEQLVKISYDLTYLYLNWMGPVRVPSPLQYVEKLCSLIQLSQQTKISRNIRSLLYFL